MITLLRRYLVLGALMFWQGGFTFYAAVVVPIGTEVLGGPVDQGFITRHVTKYLNLAGGIALVLLALDVAVCRGEWTPRRLVRWLCWLGLALTLGVLVWLHPRLDALLDPVRERVVDRPTFRQGHRWYLWTSTVQWGFGLVYVLLTLWAWRDEDRASAAAGGERGAQAAATCPIPADGPC